MTGTYYAMSNICECISPRFAFAWVTQLVHRHIAAANLDRFISARFVSKAGALNLAIRIDITSTDRDRKQAKTNSVDPSEAVRSLPAC